MNPSVHYSGALTRLFVEATCGRATRALGSRESILPMGSYNLNHFKFTCNSEDPGWMMERWAFGDPRT